MRLFRTSPSKHLVSCRQTMSGCRSPSQAVKLSTLCLIELMFQVATRMAGKNECKMLRVHPAIRRENERLLTQGYTVFTTAAHREYVRRLFSHNKKTRYGGSPRKRGSPAGRVRPCRAL